MNQHLSWFGFWIFMACIALAIGLANLNPGPPGYSEIVAMSRKEVAAKLAERGASPLAIECILNPPIFSSRCRGLTQ